MDESTEFGSVILDVSSPFTDMKDAMISAHTDVIDSNIVVFSSSDFDSLLFVLGNREDEDADFFVALFVLNCLNHNRWLFGLLERE